MGSEIKCNCTAGIGDWHTPTCDVFKSLWVSRDSQTDSDLKEFTKDAMQGLIGGFFTTNVGASAIKELEKIQSRDGLEIVAVMSVAAAKATLAALAAERRKGT